MATPATLNAWLDQLSSSILQQGSQQGSPSSKLVQNDKRLQDIFRRRVKRHNYARTNQFEVVERLNGLEEKFQILTLDNLSDALHRRRVELKDYENLWLPDALDLLLHLAGDPARNENLLALYRVPPRTGTPPPLRWKDVLADDPIDRHDRLWRVPDFRDADDSGYDEDEDDSADISKSLTFDEEDGSLTMDRDALRNGMIQNIDHAAAGNEIAELAHQIQTDKVPEAILVREILSILRGYPSALFKDISGRYKIQESVTLHEISSDALRSLIRQVTTLRQRLDLVQLWVLRECNFVYLETMKYAVEQILTSYYAHLDVMQQNFISCESRIAASIISVVHDVSVASAEIVTIADFLAQIRHTEPILCLETLFFAVQTEHVCGNDLAYNLLLGVLVQSLKAYMEPLWKWLIYGQLESAARFFVVKSEGVNNRPSRLWHDQYLLTNEGHVRPPAFLASLTTRILACGKTAAFVRHLTDDEACLKRLEDLPFRVTDTLLSAQTMSIMPFTVAFENACSEDVDTCLAIHTQTLKSLLRSNCGIHTTLNAIEQIYLGGNDLLLSDIEPKLFERIDRCQDGWNDRFQVKNLLESAFSTDDEQHTIDAITIHSVFTSSRSMQSRRRSVKILTALSFGYRLTWPLANIIHEETMTKYKRVALTLMQIRRAYYCLKRIGYLSAMQTPLGGDHIPGGQLFAQTLAFTLLNFVNTVYHCLTDSVIQPLTQTMRGDLEEAVMVDDMIAIHGKYADRLECACFVAPKLKVLRQSLVTLLDLCIRFSDLMSNSTRTSGADSDVEAGSFTSALSRSRVDAVGSDSDRDGDHAQLVEGYSSFIVLDDDTTVVKELRKLKAQYQRQLNFFVAGLKGVGKAGEQVQDLTLLADRLAWIQT